MTSAFRHRCRTLTSFAIAPVLFCLAALPRSFGGTESSPTPATSGSSNAPAGLLGDWTSFRDLLDQHGVSLGLTWVGEGFRNFEGGVNERDFVVASTADFNLTIDTEKAVNLPGGEFYVDLEDHAGQNPSSVLTGDLQGFDSYNSAPYLQIFEIYYEQKLFNDILRLKIGKVDANSEFSLIDNGLDFVNSAAQASPTILGMPTSPDPLPGANLFLTPVDSFYASFGAYLGNRGDRFLDFTGSPASIQPTRTGLFFIGEVGFKWPRAPLLQDDGNLKLGFWGHSGTFSRLEGGSQQGAQGFYAILDQTLWKPSAAEDEARGVRLFLEYGETDPKVSAIYRETAGGITWKGFLPERPADEVGFSPACAFLAGEAGLRYPYELILESFYKASLTPWATLQPDLQYIIHPGGTYSNALVGVIQLSVRF